MNTINISASQNPNSTSKISVDKTGSDGTFAEVLQGANNGELFEELHGRYSNGQNVTFQIAPEALARMTQNADYKNKVLSQVDSFLKGPFVKGHPMLSYGVQIDSRGQVAYTIEVPEREGGISNEEMQSIETKFTQYCKDIRVPFDISAYGVSEVLHIRNRFKFGQK